MTRRWPIPFTQDSPGVPSRSLPNTGDRGSRWTTLLLYLAAGVVYIAIGVFVEEFLFSFVVGAAYLLIVVWAIPALLRRLRSHR